MATKSRRAKRARSVNKTKTVKRQKRRVRRTSGEGRGSYSIFEGDIGKGVERGFDEALSPDAKAAHKKLF